MKVKKTKIQPDYSERDRLGRTAFYVLLWKRPDISLEVFDEYWRNVHGPVCARLPGQHQYWQFHVAHNPGTVWPTVKGIKSETATEDQFDGIAELTFASESDRQTWFEAASILMDDEHNIFSKAIGYNTDSNNSRTYVDRIINGVPNGGLDLLKFHVMLQKADSISLEEFRRYLTDNFASVVAQNDSVLKLRLHLFEEVDNSRSDAAGVVHTEPREKQYQAAFEIAFANSLEKERFFSSKEYQKATKKQGEYIKRIACFPERTAYTFVYEGQMTLAGQRSSKAAELISKVGAINQLEKNVVSLMNGSGSTSFSNSQGDNRSGLGQYLKGIQHFGVTVDDMEKSLEFYIEILGGKLVIAENDLEGDKIQNTLFQQEELNAVAQGTDPKTLGVPNIRDGSESLDIKFISFGNACVELINFKTQSKNGKLKTNTFNSSQPNCSHVGRVNAMHLSFHVREDVDLNFFAKILEVECQRRGLTNVVFNRIVRVKTKEERKAIALKYNSNKYWNDSETFEEDESNPDFGDFEGWALFYCKGPNGEQLEFNQVTRKIKGQFSRARQEYNRTNGTNFANSNAEVSTSTKKKTEEVEIRLPGRATNLVKQLFSRGEAFDADGFVTFFTDTPLYQFGNFEVCFDKAAIKKSANNFFSQINAVYHNIKMMWEVGDLVFVEMDVTYWRKDNSVVSLPCFDIFRLEGDKFSELRIFMDVNPVFDATISVPDNASVLTIAGEKLLQPPNIMRRFYTEDEEGKKRRAAGFTPKWSAYKPKWLDSNRASTDSNNNNKQSQENSVTMSEQLQAITKLSEYVLDRDWEQAKTLLADDILYRVGSSEPLYGKQAVVDFLSSLFKNQAQLIRHDVRQVFEEPDIISFEMDSKYVRNQDNHHLSIACCDIYRLEENRVKEWRVYADMSPFYED